MALAQYSKCTLYENWVEDRLDVDELDVNLRYLRPLETAIANVSQNRFEALSRIARVDKKPSYAVPQDGYKSLTTSVARDDFAEPKQRESPHGHAVNSLPRPSFVTEAAMNEVCKSKGPSTEYDPVIHHRGPFLGQRDWNTTAGDHFPATQPITIPDPNHPAGVGSRGEKEVSAIRLCGEKFREGDPSSDTRAQRAWLYTPDPTVELDGKMPQRRLEKDNELSLPLGDGVQLKLQKRVSERLKSGGMMYLNSTDITRGV